MLFGLFVFGSNKSYLVVMFLLKSIIVLDILVNIGFMFFFFFVGLELDIKFLLRTGKKVFSIVIVGISFSFVLGIGLLFVFRVMMAKGVNVILFFVFMGVVFFMIVFFVLVRILVELKFLMIDVGSMVMFVAVMNDVVVWILFVFVMVLFGDNFSLVVLLWVFFSGCGFVICVYFIIMKMFNWMGRRCYEGEFVDEMYMCFVLVFVFVVGFVIDIIGIYVMFGVFVVGMFFLKEGLYVGVMVESVEDFVFGFFFSLYFVLSGLKINVVMI